MRRGSRPLYNLIEHCKKQKCLKITLHRNWCENKEQTSRACRVDITGNFCFGHNDSIKTLLLSEYTSTT